ncbi:MAG: cysteine desulfurase [Gemmatimonadota bacterium]|nr:MAG: cysteine desulfurase [Gemmatimonadota bacterium]
MPAEIEGFDLPTMRAQFPALDQEVNGRRLVYLDNAATAQKPRVVLDALASYYERDNANVHRGIHELSRRATEEFEEARARIASFMNAPDSAEVVWTRGTTEAINLVAGTWALDNVGEGDEILLSTMEHHSNIVPWQMVAGRTGARIRFIEMDDQGRLLLDRLSDVLGERTKIVSLGHISNALGTVNPIAEITRRVHDAGALMMVDGAQAGPHRRVDVQELECDFYAISGHKMCGPTGIGALWARRELLEEMRPYQGGGEMIRIVEREGSTWAEVPHKFEAGTPNIAGAVGMAAAADFLEGVGFDEIAKHESAVMGYAMERLSEVPGLRIYGPEGLDERSGVISFTLGDAHPHDISTILDSEGVAVRAGHHCAQLVMRHFGVAATARASFYLYNTTDEVDRLVEALDTVRGIFEV